MARINTRPAIVVTTALLAAGTMTLLLTRPSGLQKQRMTDGSVLVLTLDPQRRKADDFHSQIARPGIIGAKKKHRRDGQHQMFPERLARQTRKRAV
jgi:hypothetical protein